MSNQTFGDLYIGDCDNCGLELEDWEWFEDDMVFRTSCSCGCEYTLEPTAGTIKYDSSDSDDEKDEDYED